MRVANGTASELLRLIREAETTPTAGRPALVPVIGLPSRNGIALSKEAGQ
jgi:hypothetical protein